jgi:hypothetical protein
MAGDRRLPINEISVVVGQDYTPFYFRDHEGRADGWLVDIWRLWSQKTGIKVHFVMALLNTPLFGRCSKNWKRISRVLIPTAH